MKPEVGSVRQCLSVALLGTMAIGSPSSFPSFSCEAIDNLTVAGVPPDSSATEQDNTAELFSRLRTRHHWQEARLARLTVVRTYKVENDKNKMLAEAVVLVEYRAPGTETFTSTSGNGSGFVIHRVFQRLMDDEEKRIRINKDPDTLITPENYTLEVVGTDKIGGSVCSIVRAVPKRKETDLFEGKLWIDNQDFAIVKITGRLAKSPSFWIKQVDFVRDYRKIDGFWLLSREEAVSVLRILGKETLTIDYQNYSVNGPGAFQPLLTKVTD